MPASSTSRPRSRLARFVPGLVAVTIIVAIVAVIVVAWAPDDEPPRTFSYEELTGSLFAPPPQGPFRAPRVRELRLPPFPDANSVWGATGRDFSGSVWVGVSTRSTGSSLATPTSPWSCSTR